MALVFALTTCTLVVVVEMLMCGFDETDEYDDRGDSTPVSIGATLLWIALLAPLFFSYH